MIRLSQLNRYGSKPLLLAIALLLLVLNVGRLAIGYYEEKMEAVGSGLELLDRYQESVAELPELRHRVTALEQRKAIFEEHLLSAGSEEEVASAMQIMLQEQLVKAGLEPESLRPLGGSELPNGKDYGALSIKVRSTGTLNDLVLFLANLSHSKQLFQIESFTLTPHNQTQLKIIIDFKGYYTLRAAL